MRKSKSAGTRTLRCTHVMCGDIVKQDFILPICPLVWRDWGSGPAPFEAWGADVGAWDRLSAGAAPTGIDRRRAGNTRRPGAA